MSSRRVGRQETRDGRRALRRVDDSFWATERTMLQTQLRMLDEFVQMTGTRDIVEVPAEECRILEYKIQCINATLMHAGKEDEANVWMEKKMEAEERFGTWYSYNQEMKMLMRSHRDPSSSSGDAIEGQHKCIDMHCKHFVYGFDTEDALRRHISLHEAVSETKTRGTSTIRQKTSTMSLDDTPIASETRQNYQDYDPSNSETERVAPLQSPFQKRELLKPMPDHQMKGLGYSTLQTMSSPAAAKSNGPCLRCKVLKKRCDCMSPCKECPQQDILAPDLWKALGCFHGPLSDLAKKSLISIEECLFKVQTPDRRELTFDVSYRDDTKLFWTAELDMLMQNELFENLDDQYWNNHALRNANLTGAGLPPPRQRQDDYETKMKRYSAAIAVLKAAPKEGEAQYTHSAFNPFTLLRLGERLSGSARDPKDWELYSLAKEFLVAAVRFRDEFQKLQSTIDGPVNHGNESKHSMSLPDIKTPLTTFLRAFDARFTNRKELTVDGWLGSFFALCIVSIIKTVLVDAAPVTQHLEKQATYAAQLNTIYKVIVSVFSWSAKVSNWCPKEFVELRDPLLYAWSSDSGQGSQMVSVQMQQALRETKKIVHQSKWASTGVKHSKDFLLGLGSGKFLDQGFNGFLVQIFRHKTSERSHHAPAKALTDTPGFTPLQPRHQPSMNAMDLDYAAHEPVNFIRPIAGMPVADPGIRPRLEPRTSTGSRRSTLPDVLPSSAHLEFIPEKMPMAPPFREDKWTAKIRPEVTPGQASYRPSPKNYHQRDGGESSDAMDENGYYSAPSRTSTLGTTFTAISSDYDRDAAQRAKFQRRESRPDLGQYNRYGEAERRDQYRPDINGRRGSDSRDHAILSRDDPGYGINRYQTQEGEPQYAPQGSYYQRTQMTQDELYHKRRHDSPPRLASNQPRDTPYNDHPHYADSVSARNGLEKGTLVFGLNDSAGVQSNRKPKRRELSKEQREQAAAVRRMGACPDCKARKIKCNPEHMGPRKLGACPECKAKKTKCDPSHHRDEDLRSSTSPQSPGYLVVEKPGKTRSPSPPPKENEKERPREAAPVKVDVKIDEDKEGAEKLVVAADE